MVDRRQVVISLKDNEEMLKAVGEQYFIRDLQYVSDIKAWAKDKSIELSEPHQPMKLVTTGDGLVMVMQEYVGREIDDVIKNLGVRWSITDNATNMEVKLNSQKKHIIYCFLKEYARCVKRVGDDELAQDEWVLTEMESLGYLNE